MKVTSIRIDDIDFNWGDTLLDIKSKFQEKTIFENDKKFTELQTLRIKTNEFLGIETNSSEFTSPDRERIINWVKIFLPLKNDKNQDVVAKMINKFGAFTVTGNIDVSLPGSLMKIPIKNYYRWELENCHLGLIFYGEDRLENFELSRGHIWMQLKDLSIFNKLYSERLTTLNKDLESQIAHGFQKIIFFDFDYKQDISHWIEEDFYPNHDIKYVSTVLNGFYKIDKLTISSKSNLYLSESQICLFQLTNSCDYYIANQYECYRLKEIKSFIYYSNHIVLDSFLIKFEKKSAELLHLISELEIILSREVIHNY